VVTLVVTSAMRLPSNATEQAGATISGDRIWLRVNADIRPGIGRQGRLSYRTDATNVTPLGRGFVMATGGAPAPSRLVSLRAHATGSYGAADDTAGALIASRAVLGTAEQFDLIG
jgi:hypothetical protein